MNAKQIDPDTKPAISYAHTSFLQQEHLQYTFPVSDITLTVIFIHTKTQTNLKY